MSYLRKFINNIKIYKNKKQYKQKIYYLIGPPAIGKSTYVNTIIKKEFTRLVRIIISNYYSN